MDPSAGGVTTPGRHAVLRTRMPRPGPQAAAARCAAGRARRKTARGPRPTSVTPCVLPCSPPARPGRAGVEPVGLGRSSTPAQSGQTDTDAGRRSDSDGGGSWRGRRQPPRGGRTDRYLRRRAGRRGAPRRSLAARAPGTRTAPGRPRPLREVRRRPGRVSSALCRALRARAPDSGDEIRAQCGLAELLSWLDRVGAGAPRAGPLCGEVAPGRTRTSSGDPAPLGAVGARQRTCPVTLTGRGTPPRGLGQAHAGSCPRRRRQNGRAPGGGPHARGRPGSS